MTNLRSQPSALLMAFAVLAGFGSMAPGARAAELEEGHPEAYENGALVGGREAPSAAVGYGEILFSSSQVGGEGIECVSFGFGSAWNEGSPLRAQGQILGWTSAGHVPITGHPKLSATCRPEGTRAFITDEGAVEFERNPTTHEVEAQHRGLSPPWNVEVSCGVREEEYVPIVKIGVPTSEFPVTSSTPCPAEPNEEAQHAEEAAYVSEREQNKGCYASNPAPEGCVGFTWVEPGASLEVAWGGTLWAKGVNGVKNGLNPSRWVFEEHNGELQCESAGCSSGMTETGEAKVLGYGGVQLIQAR